MFTYFHPPAHCRLSGSIVCTLWAVLFRVRLIQPRLNGHSTPEFKQHGRSPRPLCAKLDVKSLITNFFNQLCWEQKMEDCSYGQSPRLQESCDPSSVLVCSDLHLCLTSFIIEVMHRPFRKCIVIHILDKKKFAFDHCNAIKMTFLACRQLEFLS